MKNNRFFCSALLLLLLGPVLAMGCQIDIQLEPGAPPAVGGTGIVIVTVKQTHNQCTLPMEQTKVKTAGCAIISATPWKETKPRVFTRKFKIKFETAGEALLEINRTCSRDKNVKEFRFKISP